MGAAGHPQRCPVCGAEWPEPPDTCPSCRTRFRARIWVGPFDEAEVEAHARSLLSSGVDLYTESSLELATQLRRSEIRVGPSSPEAAVKACVQLDAAGIPYRFDMQAPAARGATNPSGSVGPKKPSGKPSALGPTLLSVGIVVGFIGAMFLMVYVTASVLEPENVARRESKSLLVKGEPPASRPAPPAQVPRVENGLVRISSGRGMGFAVGQPTYILTVTSAVMRPTTGERVAVSTLDGRNLISAYVAATDERYGFVLLECRQDGGCNLSPLTVDSALNAKVRDFVAAWSGPQELGQTYQEGYFNHAPWRDGERLIYQTNIPVTKASRGGPLLNNDGRVVGVLIDDPPAPSGVGFVVPIEHATFGAGRILRGVEGVDGGANDGRIRGLRARAAPLPRRTLERRNEGPKVKLPSYRRDAGVPEIDSPVRVQEAFQNYDGSYLKVRFTLAEGESVPRGNWVLVPENGPERSLGRFERVMTRQDLVFGRTFVHFQRYGERFPVSGKCALRIGDIVSPSFKFADPPENLAEILRERRRNRR